MILTKVTHAVVAVTALSIPIAILQPSELATATQDYSLQSKDASALRFWQQAASICK